MINFCVKSKIVKFQVIKENRFLGNPVLEIKTITMDKMNIIAHLNLKKVNILCICNKMWEIGQYSINVKVVL